MMHRRQDLVVTRRRLHLGIAAAAIAVGLVGCAPASSYDAAAAERLQARVESVTVAAASADHAGVLGDLETLEVELRDALARDQITQARFDSVTAAIALVRADAEAALAASQPAPAPAPVEQVPVEVPAADDPGEDGPPKGPGNNNGDKGKKNKDD
jgi:hypothetical protein